MKILFVTRNYPPNNTGAAVVMSNLILGLDQDIVAGVVTEANSKHDQDEIISGVKVFKLFSILHYFNPKVWLLIDKLFYGFELRKLIKIIDSNNVTHIVGVYPDLNFLNIASQSAKKAGVKFIPYLHDTVAEGLSHKWQNKHALKIQNRIFDNSDVMFVMSQGMKDLYRKKYQIETVPLLHSFSETPKSVKPNINLRSKSIFWGGSIYSINKETVKRIHNACIELDFNLTLSAANNKENLNRMGYVDRNIIIAPFFSRPDYLDFLKKQSALLLSIDWSDESLVHFDELATIFPTKTIEYLTSGKPIIVHCPEDYFLAKFFKKHDCGLLIHDRDPLRIQELLTTFFNDQEIMERKINNAFLASEQFHISRVVNVFKKEIINPIQ
jgi:hypothetical protein